MRAFTDLASGYNKCQMLRRDPPDYSGQGIGPTDSQWRQYFFHPEECPNRETWLRNYLPKYDTRVWESYGGSNISVLYFEHRPARHIQVIMVLFFATGFALYLEIVKGYISEAFNGGAFVLGLIALIAGIYSGRRNLT